MAPRWTCWCRAGVTDKLRSYAAANRDLGLDLDHRQHKGLNNRAENSHQPTRVTEKVMRRFKSARHLQRFVSTHDQVANLFMHSRYNRDAAAKRAPTPPRCTTRLRTWTASTP